MFKERCTPPKDLPLQLGAKPGIADPSSAHSPMDSLRYAYRSERCMCACGCTHTHTHTLQLICILLKCISLFVNKCALKHIYIYIVCVCVWLHTQTRVPLWRLPFNPRLSVSTGTVILKKKSGSVDIFI